jgi:hypothetical protein
MGFLIPTTSVTVDNPRTDEFSLSNSTFGEPIPIPFGTVRVPGNIIWAAPIREEKVTETKKSGGKGGGGKVKTTTTTYYYYASFGIAFGEGVVNRVRRIWADSKLIYDITGAGTTTSVVDLTFRFYPGTETQEPDALIENDVGSDLAPAHRGLCYIVFDELSLANFGNRIPNIEAELETDISSELVIGDIDLSPTDISYTQDLIVSSASQDYARGFIYVADEQTGTGEILVFSTSTNSLVSVLPAPETESLLGVIPSNGDLVASDGASTLRILNSFNGAVKSSGGISVPIDRLPLNRPSTLAVSGLGRDALFSIQDGANNIVGYDLEDFSVIGTWEAQISGTLSVPVNGSRNQGDLYYAEVSTTSINFYRLQLTTSDVQQTLIGAVQASDLREATSLTERLMTWEFDPILNCAFFNIGSDVGNTAARFDFDLQGINWAVSTPSLINGDFSGIGMNRTRGGRYVYPTSEDTFLAFNASNGERSTFKFTGSDEAGVFFYDDSQRRYFGFDDVFRLLKTGVLEASAPTGGVPVSFILDKICTKAGLELVADFNTSDLSSATVEGYIIREQAPAAEAITPLSRLLQFDVVSSDYKIHFRLRSDDTIQATLTDDDLIRLRQGQNEPYIETRIQESEIPAVYETTYLDKDNAYQQNTQRAQRVRAPITTVQSDNAETLEIDAVLSADTAKQASEILLYNSWTERLSFALRTSWEFLYLDPSDSIQLDFQNVEVQARLTNADIGADLSFESTTVSETQGVYISNAEGETGDNNIQVSIPSVSPSELFLLDIPLLRDIDDTGGSTSRLYLAASNYGQMSWPGCLVLNSADNAAFDEISQHQQEAAWGVTATVISDPTFENAIDETDSFDLTVVSGLDDFSSVTNSEIYQGANTLAVIKANGNIEILQFKTVTIVSGQRITLSGLLRGRRGTDVFSTGHAIGETCILLETASVESTQLSIGNIGSSLFYKAPTNGTILEDAESQQFASNGNDLKPYAPVKVEASIDMSDDITITWIRRTRIGGELKNSDGVTPIDVPLSETQELYDLEFLDGVGGAVLSNITELDLTSETATISLINLNNELTSDITGAGDDITVRVYQKSGNTQIGRGFAREVTITIAAA